jgi:ATP-binding cassette subfamily F protein 3
VNGAERELEAAHADQARLEQLLTDGDLYIDSNKSRLRELLLEKAEVDSRCERLEQDWMEACEALEALQTAE